MRKSLSSKLFRPRLETLEIRENLAPTLLTTTALPGANRTWDFATGPFGASAVFADLEGDGPQELLAPGGDGNLYAYRFANNRLEIARTFATGQASEIHSTPVVVDVGRVRAVFAANIAGYVFGWDAKTGLALPGWPVLNPTQPSRNVNNGVYSSLASGDLDGDFVPEIVATAANHEITAFRYDGTVLWQFSNDDTVFSTVVIGDINRDGKPEVVVGGDSAPSQFYWAGGRINVLSAEGRRVWVRATDQVIWSSPILVDLNADGYLEVVTGTGYYYPNAGSFIYAYDHLGNDLPGWPYITGPASGQNRTMSSPAAADLDGDGAMEIVIGDGEAKLYALRGNGQPLWVVQAFDRQNLWSSPVIADINGDNRPDILIGAEGLIRGFDGRTGAMIWDYWDGKPHYAAGGVGHLKGDSSWQVAFVGWARGAGAALLSPSGLTVFDAPPTNLPPPWALFRQDAAGNAVARPDNSVTDLIQNLYRVVLRREAGPSEVNHWVKIFTRTPNLRTWIWAVSSSYEGRTLQITGWYQDYLRRKPESIGLEGWHSYLAAGISYNAARAGIIASREAFQNAGGTNTGWMTYLYQTLLGRTPGSGEANGWLDMLNTGKATRDQVVPAFQGAPETLARLINSWYAGFRPAGLTTAPADSLAAMSWDIRRGKPEEQVLADMLTSNGDYLVTQAEGSWLRAAYPNMLKRPVATAEAANWMNRLEREGVTLTQIADLLARSAEHHHVLVDGWYRQYLGRASSAAERAGYVDALNRGVRRVDLLAGLLQGEEYFNRAGRNTTTFINQLTTDLWGYGPNAEQLAAWQSRATRENIRVTLTQEHLITIPWAYARRTIDLLYLDLLRRLPSTPPDNSRLIAAGVPYEAQNWVNFWAGGGNPVDIEVNLLVSAEYQQLARSQALWTGARWLS